MKYKKNFEIITTNDIDSIMLKLEFNLRKEGFHTSGNYNRFEFKRIYKTTTDKAENLGNATHILREGVINLDNKGNDKIRLSYSVNLNYLFFMSLMVAILIGLINQVIEKEILHTIMIGALSFCCFFLTGILLIRFRMMSLVRQST